MPISVHPIYSMTCFAITVWPTYLQEEHGTVRPLETPRGLANEVTKVRRNCFSNCHCLGRHRSFTGAAYGVGVLGEDAAFEAGFGGLPCGETFGDLCFGDV